MIRGLRRWHRRIFWVVAVALPLLMAYGIIAGRPSWPDRIPPAFEPDRELLPHLLVEKEAFWPEPKVTAIVSSDTRPPTRLRLELVPEEEVQLPDLMLYWCPSPVEIQTTLPPDAVFLGESPLTWARQFELPTNMFGESSSVVLYSLAYKQVVANGILDLRPEALSLAVSVALPPVSKNGEAAP